MRKQLDLRTLFKSLEDGAPPADLTSRIMNQVAMTRRPVPTPVRRTGRLAALAWLRPAIAMSGATALLLFGGRVWLGANSWLSLLDGVEASLLGATELLVLAVSVLAASGAFLNGAVLAGESTGLVLSTPTVTAAVAAVTLLCLVGVALLHRLAQAAVIQRRRRGVRTGAIVLAFGLGTAGVAFGQPGTGAAEGAQQSARESRAQAQEAQEQAQAQAQEAAGQAQQEQLQSLGDAVDALEERLDEALDDATQADDGDAQSVVEDALERIEDLERDLAAASDQDRRSDGRSAGDGARRGRDNNRVAFGSMVRVGRDEVASEVVSIGGGAEIDGVVRGDVVAVGGGVKIAGRVTGEVVSILGNVELGPDADVGGDAVSVGGYVSYEDRNDIGGDIAEVPIGSFEWGDWDWSPNWNDSSTPRVRERSSFLSAGKLMSFLWNIVFTGVLIVLAGFVLLVVPKAVGRVRTAALANPWVLLAVGFGIELLFLPAMVVATLLLVVTVVGIPFAVLLWPVAGVALAAALLLGYSGVALAAGNWFRERFEAARRLPTGSFAAIALGVLVIQALALAADLLGFLGMPWFLRAMLWIPGFVVCWLAWSIGLGAACVTRFGTADHEAAPTTPVPPPAQPPETPDTPPPAPPAPEEQPAAAAAETVEGAKPPESEAEPAPDADGESAEADRGGDGDDSDGRDDISRSLVPKPPPA